MKGRELYVRTWLSVVGKVYAEILVDRFCRVTECLIDDEQEGYRLDRGAVDQISTLKQLDEKAQEKTKGVYAFYRCRESI